MHSGSGAPLALVLDKEEEAGEESGSAGAGGDIRLIFYVILMINSPATSARHAKRSKHFARCYHVVPSG